MPLTPVLLEEGDLLPLLRLLKKQKNIRDPLRWANAIEGLKEAIQAIKLEAKENR